jgi:tetratricopeptide (TPR) repeat protein
MSRPPAALVCIAVLLCAGSARAQGKDAFVQHLSTLVETNERGIDGRAISAAVDALTTALGEWDQAIGRAESGLSADIKTATPSTAARMRAALGAAYLERGRVADALAQFDSVLKLDPAFADGHVLRALALETGNTRQQAAAEYHAAWRADQSSPIRAYLFLRSAGPADANDRASAVRVLSKALDGSARDQRAARFFSASLVDEAAAHMPQFPPAIYNEGFALVLQGRYADAASRLTQASQRDPLVTDAALKADEVIRAIAPLQRGNANEAIVGLLAILDRYASSSEVHRILGVALWTGHQEDKARSELDAAVRLDRQNERARLALADLLFESGDAPRALETLRETVRDIPASGTALWKLGDLYQRFGNEADALQSFEAASKLPAFTGLGDVLAAVGRLYNNRFDLESAAAAYARRMALNPNDGAAHADLGEIYLAQDHLDDALAEFLVAALLDPANGRLFAKIGQVHAAAGRDADAVPMLRRALMLDGSQLEARYGLSRALLRLGRTDEAQAELRLFEDAQKKAMDAQRRRVLDDQRKLEETVGAGEPRGTGR